MRVRQGGEENKKRSARKKIGKGPRETETSRQAERSLGKTKQGKRVNPSASRREGNNHMKN